MPSGEEARKGLGEDGTGSLGLINWKAGGITAAILDAAIPLLLVVVEECVLTGKDVIAVEEDTAVDCF